MRKLFLGFTFVLASQALAGGLSEHNREQSPVPDPKPLGGDILNEQELPDPDTLRMFLNSTERVNATLEGCRAMDRLFRHRDEHYSLVYEQKDDDFIFFMDSMVFEFPAYKRDAPAHPIKSHNYVFGPEGNPYCAITVIDSKIQSVKIWRTH